MSLVVYGHMFQKLAVNIYVQERFSFEGTLPVIQTKGAQMDGTSQEAF